MAISWVTLTVCSLMTRPRFVPSRRSIHLSKLQRALLWLRSFGRPVITIHCVTFGSRVSDAELVVQEVVVNYSRSHCHLVSSFLFFCRWNLSLTSTCSVPHAARPSACVACPSPRESRSTGGTTSSSSSVQSYACHALRALYFLSDVLVNRTPRRFSQIVASCVSNFMRHATTPPLIVGDADNPEAIPARIQNGSRNLFKRYPATYDIPMWQFRGWKTLSSEENRPPPLQFSPVLIEVLLTYLHGGT